MNKYIFIVLLLCAVFGQSAYAQQAVLKGQFTSKTDNSSLIGVGVMLVNKQDTNQKKETLTDAEGNFRFIAISAGSYQLRTFYVGFKGIQQNIVVTGKDQDLGAIKLEETATSLKEVKVEEKMIRSVQKNDTTEYNANAFKTQPDATTQDLVAKMPGVTVENGTVKAHGETVQKVLIDGKEFFGDDAAIALKNLPAEVVDKIQVFDKMSDQAQFTRFDDGNSQKTINVVTKGGKSNGQFGKIYGGYGTDDRYSAGGNINLFSGKRRIALIGLSNNINQQNFSSQDLLGVTGGSNQNRGPGGGPGGGGFSGRGGGMGGPGGGGQNNFLVGQQGGINQTHSIGMNYSDTWGKKINITGSYFFNEGINTTENQVQRTYFLGNGRNQYYNQLSNSTSDNMNHRINVRFEYNIDTSNSFIITPKLSFQNNTSFSTVGGVNSYTPDSLLNSTYNKTDASNSGYSFSNNILYRHKFLKAGRTISLNIGTDLNHKTGESILSTENEYFMPNDSLVKYVQRTDTKSQNNTLSAFLIYTEPLGKKGQLMFNYAPSYNKNISDKETNTKDTITEEFSNLSNTLSSNFDNTLMTQRGGASYRFQNERTNFMIGANYQVVKLEGSQSFPTEFSVNKTFQNVLPSAMYNYKFSKNSNLRMYYRTSTNAPSISQLQTVVDNSNPLLLSTGNPNLHQEFAHMLITRYSFANTDKGRSLFLFANVQHTQDYIGNSTYLANSGSVVVDNVLLNRGAQLTRPVNLDGYWNISSFATYGLPVKALKSNLNLNLGVTYNRTPSLINNAENDANTYTPNGGFVLASNISEKIDFSISYSANYNIVKNTIQASLNSNYFYQLSSAKFNWLPWKGLVIGSDITHTYYTGLGSSFNQNYFLWNAGVGYKFLKNRAAEIRLNAFDLLNQNNSISRTVTGTYIEDSRTKVLRQYFMVVFTYTLRNFKTTPQPAAK